MLDTTIEIFNYLIPAALTNCSQNVHIEYTCLCSIDDKGNFNYTDEYIGCRPKDLMGINANCWLQVINYLREEAAKKFQGFINESILPTH